MREYNLFVIQKEYFTLYQKKPELLFGMLYNLFQMHANFNYGITLFEQLCKKIEVDAIRYYFWTKYRCQGKEKYRFKNGVIFIRPSRIIIQSTINLPNVLSIFYRYNKMIFVCDFENQDYFFLDEFLKHKLLQTI